jgi:hypothetical protein
MIELFVVITDGTHQYYLLKVQRHGFDVYCFPPHLGIHVSLHESGESHFRFEEKTGETGKEPPVVLMAGEAGTPVDGGIMCASLKDLGRAAGICTACYPIDSLGKDFQGFNRKPKECFVIDKGLFSEDTKIIEIGVWAVPARNKVSFEFNNPNISADLLYKVDQCEPQIWIYAKPFACR